MTDQEIVSLGEAFRAKPNGLRAAALFLLLTGAREGVVLNLQAGTIDLDQGVLRFEAKAPGLKGARKVYFSPSAAALLPQIPSVVLKRSLCRQWGTLRAEAGLGPRPGTKTEDLGVTLHDLRRTFSSWAINHGHEGQVVHILQGHSEGKVQAAYQIHADPMMSKLASEIGESLASLLGIAV
jgi:integrase